MKKRGLKMNEGLKNIATIYINDTKFEEENEGVIIVKSFGNIKIGLGISQRLNGDAELWFNVNEAQKIISALENAIMEVKEY
jgi:hypothetical protein